MQNGAHGNMLPRYCWSAPIRYRVTAGVHHVNGAHGKMDNPMKPIGVPQDNSCYISQAADEIEGLSHISTAATNSGTALCSTQRANVWKLCAFAYTVC